MTDPDAPSRKEPKWREWVHWGVINLSATGSDGEEVIQYIGSGPPKDTGHHRYCFLLFEHQDKVKSERPILVNTNGEGRGGWSVHKFAKELGIDHKLVDVTYFLAEYDDYVPILYKKLSGK